MDVNVVKVDFNKTYPVEDMLLKDIKDIIYSYGGNLSVASVLGVLDIINHDLKRDLL